MLSPDMAAGFCTGAVPLRGDWEPGVEEETDGETSLFPCACIESVLLSFTLLVFLFLTRADPTGAFPAGFFRTSPAREDLLVDSALTLFCQVSTFFSCVVSLVRISVGLAALLSGFLNLGSKSSSSLSES